MKGQQIYQWFNSHKKFLIFIGIVFVITMSVFNFFSRNSLVNLKIDSNENTQNIITYASLDAGNTKVGGSGLLIIPRETKSLLIENGVYQKTQTKIDIPWYGYVSKSVKIIQDTNAEKVALKSSIDELCTTYSPGKDKILYYSCRNPKALFYFDTPNGRAWVSKKVTDLYYSNYDTKPYLGGVIGIAQTYATDIKPQGDISVTTENGQHVFYNTPEGLDTTTLNQARIFTDSYNTSNKNFIIVDKNGNIYLGKPAESNKVSYEKITATKNYNSEYNQTLCSIVGEVVNCLIGKKAVGDLPENHVVESIADYEILTASFSDSGTRTTKITNGIINMDNIYNLNGKIYAKHYKKLYRLDKYNNSYSLTELLQNVDDVSAGDDLYVIQNKAIFRYNPQTLDFNQIFYSKNINPKAIFTVSGKTFITASSMEKKSITYAYLLNNTPNTDHNNRLIDIFPMPNKNLTGAVENDLVGNSLSITLPVSIIRTSQGTTTDAGEISARKQEVLETIRNYTSQIPENNIQFVY